MRTTPRAAAIAIAVGAVALRIPAYLATRHLSFDDGVYGASAVAMREGGLPFRDVFSSQGPLFLPLVWLADLLGLRTFDAPRLLALASAVALVLATWAAARALQLCPGAAGVAAALVATSGSVLWVTGPLTSDGPSLALATGGGGCRPVVPPLADPGRAVMVGLLIGAALSVKSLLVAPAVTVGLALLPSRGRRPAPRGPVRRRCPVGLTSGRRWPPPASSAWRSPSPGASATCGTRPSGTTSMPPAPAPRSPTSARSSPPSATATCPSSWPPLAPSVSPRADPRPDRPTPRRSWDPERIAHNHCG